MPCFFFLPKSVCNPVKSPWTTTLVSAASPRQDHVHEIPFEITLRHSDYFRNSRNGTSCVNERPLYSWLWWCLVITSSSVSRFQSFYLYYYFLVVKSNTESRKCYNRLCGWNPEVWPYHEMKALERYPYELQFVLWFWIFLRWKILNEFIICTLVF